MLNLIVFLGLFPTTAVTWIVISERLLADILCLCWKISGRNIGKFVMSSDHVQLDFGLFVLGPPDLLCSPR